MWTPQEAVSGCWECAHAISAHTPTGLRMVKCAQGIGASDGPCLWWERGKQTSDTLVIRVNKLPRCDRCGRAATAVSMTDDGQKNLCVRCFLSFGKGIGLNLGQLYMLTDQRR